MWTLKVGTKLGEKKCSLHSQKVKDIQLLESATTLTGELNLTLFFKFWVHIFNCSVFSALTAEHAVLQLGGLTANIPNKIISSMKLPSVLLQNLHKYVKYLTPWKSNLLWEWTKGIADLNLLKQHVVIRCCEWLLAYFAIDSGSLCPICPQW